MLTDGRTDGLTDWRTDGQKIGRLYRTLLQAGAIKMKVDILFFTIKHYQIFTLTKGHGAGVTVGKCMCMEMFCFFLFFCDLIPHFSSFLFLFSSLFFCLLLCILYAKPFEPHLSGVDGAALQRYIGKPNCWSENLIIFSHFGSLLHPFFTC